VQYNIIKISGEFSVESSGMAKKVFLKNMAILGMYTKYFLKGGI